MAIPVKYRLRSSGVMGHRGAWTVAPTSSAWGRLRTGKRRLLHRSPGGTLSRTLLASSKVSRSLPNREPLLDAQLVLGGPNVHAIEDDPESVADLQ